MNEPRAHSRTSDPSTSTLAALSVRNLTETQERVLTLLERGETTRDDLIALWRVRYPTDKTTDQSIRSRLAELMDDQRVVVTDHRLNARNRQVQVVGLPRENPTLF